MEGMPKTPRSRVPNFTSDEKALLAALIKSKPIVESKATDGKSVEKKKAAWESITQEFNCQAYVHKRDTINLKRAWDNMKAFTRKVRAAERGSLFKTGGGPAKPTPPPHQDAIISMVEEAAPVIICEVKNSYDSDGCLLSSLGEEEVKSSDGKIDDNEPDKNQHTESEVTLTNELPIQVINNTATQDGQNIPFSPTDCVPRKPADYVRREGVLRIKNLEVKKRLEAKILNLKLSTQEIKNQAAELKLQRNKKLLEKATLELEILKNSLQNKTSD